MSTNACLWSDCMLVGLYRNILVSYLNAFDTHIARTAVPTMQTGGE